MSDNICNLFCARTGDFHSLTSHDHFVDAEHADGFWAQGTGDCSPHLTPTLATSLKAGGRMGEGQKALWDTHQKFVHKKAEGCLLPLSKRLLNAKKPVFHHPV